MIMGFKIKNRTTGLFKGAGTYGGWQKTGKIWNSIGGLKLHLDLCRKYKETKAQFLARTSDWEIVTLQLVECSTTDIGTLVERMSWR
jgi:hypothetical protein